MIPIRLRLNNFMCYRDNIPPLSFEGIHTACISGDNGNGKSTLIDAMTWALWGKARAKSDDDLIYLNEGEMEVEFDFAVGPQVYRIRRKHAKPKRPGGQGKTLLELQVADDGVFKAITGDTATQTQQKIIDILHMDYTTFVNSALLLQGRADEFTIKRPVERKQVLGDILGLAFYDALEEQAKERAREREMEKARLESHIQDIDRELEQRPACEASLASGQAQLETIEKEAAEKDARLNSLRLEKETLENKKKELVQLEQRLRQTTQNLERWEAQAKQHQARLAEYEALISKRADVEAGYIKFSEARKLAGELDQKLRLLTNLKERHHQLELSITKASQSLVQEHAVIQSRLAELETGAQKLPALKAELTQVQNQLGQLKAAEDKLAQDKQIAGELRTQVNYLESSLKQTEREIKELEEKLDLLHHQEGATACPLCHTELAAEGIKIIEDKYTADRARGQQAMKENGAELAQKKQALAAKEKELVRDESGLNKDKTSLQARAGILSREIAQAEEAAARREKEQQSLTEIEELMASRSFAANEQQAMGEIEKELDTLKYDSGEHEAVRKRLSELEPYEGQKRKLEEAERLLEQEKEAIARAGEAATELRQGLEAEKQKGVYLSEELKRLPKVAAEFARAESEQQSVTARKKQAQEAVWNAVATLERLKEMEKKRRDTDKLTAQAGKEAGIYKDLAQAFGKRGIQALLIESALPEIETEANKLLGRMTDNRMHIKLETQREKKTGGVTETLDIRISDEVGTRNYEMYSGGEAFRINFAIRIALSKLLARRAGAPLPTLVIDEGFGTQDAIGIEKIKEAINSIQDDFEKILVITHIEELRDAFPTRINVVKKADGATIEVN